MMVYPAGIPEIKFRFHSNENIRVRYMDMVPFYARIPSSSCLGRIDITPLSRGCSVLKESSSCEVLLTF